MPQTVLLSRKRSSAPNYLSSAPHTHCGKCYQHQIISHQHQIYICVVSSHYNLGISTKNKSSAPVKSVSFLLGVKVPYEEITLIPDDVLEIGRNGAIIGLHSYPRPSHNDVLTVISHLPPAACKDFDRVSQIKRKIHKFYFTLLLLKIYIPLHISKQFTSLCNRQIVMIQTLSQVLKSYNMYQTLMPLSVMFCFSIKKRQTEWRPFLSLSTIGEYMR